MSVHDLQAPKEDGALLAYPPLRSGRNGSWRTIKADWLPLHLDILGKPFQTLRTLARSKFWMPRRQYLTAAGEHSLHRMASIRVGRPSARAISPRRLDQEFRPERPGSFSRVPLR